MNVNRRHLTANAEAQNSEVGSGTTEQSENSRLT